MSPNFLFRVQKSVSLSYKTEGFAGTLVVIDERPATWYPLQSACWRDEQDWDTLSCRQDDEDREGARGELAGLRVTVPEWPDEDLSPDIVGQAVETFSFEPMDPVRKLSQPPACLVFEGLHRYR